MNEPAVLIGAPIRNMEKTVPLYLEAILRLDYPKKKIALLWIVNDSKDQSLKMLQDFKEQYEKKYKRIEIQEINWGAVEDAKTAEARYGLGEWSTVDSMARAKNILKDSLMPDEEYFFYIEGDIILTKGSLKTLMAHQKSIVGALCKTGDGENHYNILEFNQVFDRFERNGMNIPTEFSKVDFISGPVLFHKDVLSKIEFAKIASGEDAQAMRMCMDKEIDRWLDPNVFLDHLYSVR